MTIWRTVAPYQPGSDAEQDHAVGELERLVDVVGDQEDRRRRRGVDVEQEVLHLQPGQGVERPERLVEQQHPWVAGQGPRQRRSLGHAARDLPRPVAGEGRQTDQVEQSLDTIPADADDVPGGSPSATLPASVRHGRSRGSWKANAQRGSMPVTGSPPIVTAPVVGVSRPAVIRRSVDLPHPLVPRIATTSPGWTESEMSRRTTWSVSRPFVRCPRERPAKTEEVAPRAWCRILLGAARLRCRVRSAGGGSMAMRARSWSVLVAGRPDGGGVGGWPGSAGTQKSRSPLSDCGPGTGDRSPSAVDDATYRPVSPPWGRQGIHIADIRACEVMAA